MAKKETFLKNAPKARRRKKRNGPELVIYGAAGNPFKRRSRRNRRTLMAKKHKSRRTHRRKKNSWFDHAKQHATAARKGWRGRKRSKRSNPFRRSRRRAARRGMRMNLPKIASGLIRLPSMQELLWVGVGSLGMPFINKTVTGLIPVDALKTGYGNIATEFVIGSVASGFARKFAGSTAGDVLFLLTLARAVGRVGYRLSNGTVGFEDADQLGAEGFSAEGFSAEELGYYNPQLGYSDVNPGFNGPDTPDSM
jgi:hypothetical protein